MGLQLVRKFRQPLYHNLKANPACTLTVRGQSLECTAREVSGEERDRYWRAAVENYSGFGRYQTRTSRAIEDVPSSVELR